MYKKNPSEAFTRAQLENDPVVQRLIEAGSEVVELELREAENRIKELKSQSSRLDIRIDLLKSYLEDEGQQIDPNDPFLKANGIDPESLAQGEKSPCVDQFLSANNLSTDSVA